MTPPASALSAAIPLQPDADEARDWLERELADPIYDAAEPNLLDRAARAVQEFFGNLFSPSLPDGWGPTAAIVAAVIVAIVIVAALLIWGRPRATPRSRAAAVPLFGEDDARSATELRADAAAAAADARWDAAVILRFRALARALAERAIIDPAPGATAQSFARDAARAFPAFTDRFAATATVFDDVRYLRRPGSEALYRDLAAFDDDITRARPMLVGSAP